MRAWNALGMARNVSRRDFRNLAPWIWKESNPQSLRTLGIASSLTTPLAGLYLSFKVFTNPIAVHFKKNYPNLHCYFYKVEPSSMKAPISVKLAYQMHRIFQIYICLKEDNEHVAACTLWSVTIKLSNFMVIRYSSKYMSHAILTVSTVNHVRMGLWLNDLWHFTRSPGAANCAYRMLWLRR